MTPGFSDIGTTGTTTPERGLYVEPDLVISRSLRGAFSLVGLIGVRVSNDAGTSTSTEQVSGLAISVERKLSAKTVVIEASPRIVYTLPQVDGLSFEAGPMLGLGRAVVTEEATFSSASYNASSSESLTCVTSTAGIALGAQYAPSRSFTVGVETSYQSCNITVDGQQVKANGLNAGVTAGYWF